MRLPPRPLALLLLLALAAGPARAQTAAAPALGEALEAVLDAPELADAFWGALVVNLATGDTLFARNEGKHFIPASNQKILTTAAALDALGPDFRYTTSLYLDGPVRGGTLEGHLVVRGSGDPTIGDRFFPGDPTALFRAWADSLRAAGVRAVTEHVIGDDGIFDELLLGKGWAWDDEPTAYAAQISGLSFNEGRVVLSIEGQRPGQRARLSWTPLDTDYVFFVNHTRTVANGRGSARAPRREQGGNTVWVEAEVAQGQRLARAVSVHNPTRFFVHVLREVLRAEGLEVGGDPVDARNWRQPLDYGRLRPVASHPSPPLAEIAAVTNKESQNLYAEHLLKTLGALRCEAGRAWARARQRSAAFACGSAEAGWAAAGPFLEEAGLDVARMRLADGSGMSPYNMLTPSDVVALLAHMWRHPNEAVREAFVASLAVGGEDGTLKRRFTAGPARGNVMAKTGTITGARNLSGYVVTAGGTPLAFSLLCNLYGTSTRRITQAQNELVERLARYPG